MIMTFHRTAGMAALAGALIFLNLAAAQDPVPQSDPKTSKAKTSSMPKSPDSKFVMEAAQGGMTEVKLGELASTNATSPEVKRFGQRMVDDHSKANEQLKSIASQKGIDLPTDVGSKNQAAYDRIAKLSGEEFDKAYMQLMVSDHKKDVSEFQKEATSGKDQDVKAFASTALPTLQEHLRLAQNLNKLSEGANSADRIKD